MPSSNSAPVVYRLWVHLARDEWSSDEGGRKMENVAKEYAALHGCRRPLLVTVHEHGGWWLSYLFDGRNDGLVVGTANDRARMSEEALAAGRRYKDARPEYIDDIRR